MHLLASQYQEIVRQVHSELSQMRNPERRKSPRVGLRARVRLIPCLPSVTATFRTVRIRDISVEGIGLLFPQSIEPGTFLVLTLPINRVTDEQELEPTLDLLYTVTRNTPLPDGQFSVGARFDRMIAPEDLN